MKKELIKKLKNSSLKEIKLTLRENNINIFDILDIEDLLLLDDFNKFSYFYNKKELEKFDLLSLAKASLQLGNSEILSLILSNRNLINYQRRTNTCFANIVPIDNLEVVKIYLKSELSISFESIEKIAIQAIKKDNLVVLNYLFDKYNSLLQSKDCWISFSFASIEILQLYFSYPKSKYLNNMLISRCFIDNKVEHIELLLSKNKKHYEFIEFVAKKRNRRFPSLAKYNSENNDKAFESLLKVTDFISQFSKKEINLFRNEDDKQALILARQTNKIVNF